MTQTQTPGRLAFARLFPPMTMTAAKAEARAIGVTVRPDPLGPCLNGGRLIEVFPLGQGGRGVSALDPAEALFLARAFALDESSNRLGFSGPSMDSKVRVIVAAALEKRGVGAEGVSLRINLTSGPTASAEVLATMDSANGRVTARGHDFTGWTQLAMMAEELAEVLASRFLGDIEGTPIHDLGAEARARFFRLESVRVARLGVNEATADAARVALQTAETLQSSGPRFYREAARAFRASAELFGRAIGQTSGHGKRARYQEAAEAMALRADLAEANAAPEAAPVQSPAEAEAVKELALMERNAAEVWAEGRGAWIHVLGLDCVATGPDSWVYHDGGPAGLTDPGMTRAAALAFLTAAIEGVTAEGFPAAPAVTLCPEVPTAEAEAKAGPRFVDVTPTWAGLIPAFRAVLENGTAEGQAMVWAELTRMAQAADSAVAAAKAEERAQIEAARAAEAEAVAALSDIMAPRPCHTSAEGESILDAGAVNRAERARQAAEPLTREGQAPEAQNAAHRAQNAAGAAMHLAAARGAVRAAKRAAQPPASGFSLTQEFGPSHWQGKAAESFREAAAFAELAGLTDAALIMARAAEIAADKAQA